MRAGCNSAYTADLRHLFSHGTAPLGDRELLDRFLADRDQAAFETLLARHGPMVLGVCRRLTNCTSDADDAFQATFLILVRKGPGIRDANRLGPWLYGVAARVATKARAQDAKRRQRLSRLCQGEEGGVSYETSNSELLDIRPILDAELARIPTKLRDVLVLCLLEDVTAQEASDRLGCPLGTVKSRLARGIEALRSRLVRRGIASAVALLASSRAFSDQVPEPLARTTLSLAAGSSAVVAPSVAILTKGVASAMLPRLSVSASLLLGSLTLAGLGTMLWTRSPANAQLTENGTSADSRQAKDFTPRQVSERNTRHILLAFHNYYSANEHFPAMAIYGSNGQPLLSWRVALLPYLEQGELYNQFHLDEPWDSPHNKALIARMPDVFKTPDAPAPDGESRLRGFIGDGAMFDGAEGVSIPDVTDGTSNTLLLASAKVPTIWTKPGELVFEPGKPMPLLNDAEPNSCMVGLCDGAVRYISPRDWILLANVLTRGGGEIIQWPVVNDSPVPPLSNTPPLAPPRPRAGRNGRMAGGMAMMAAAGESGPVPPSTPPMMGMTAAAGGGPAPTAPLMGMTAAAGGGGPGPAPTAHVASPIEERLQRLEDKLDRIIERLDAEARGVPKR